MSDIGYLLLLRAIVLRAEQDARSDDPKLRAEAVAFLAEYGDRLCRFLEQYMKSAVELRRRVNGVLRSADCDAEFRAAVNKQFVRYAVERYGIRPLSRLTGISRHRLRHGQLQEDELQRLQATVAAIDERVMKHARELAEMCGRRVSLDDPWDAIALVKSFHCGVLQL